MRGFRAIAVALLAALVASGAALAVEGSLRAASLEASGLARLLADDALLAARSRSGALEFKIEGAEGFLDREWAPEASVYAPVIPGRLFGTTIDQLRQTQSIPLRGATITSTFARPESALLVWGEAPGMRATLTPDADLLASAHDPTTVQSHTGQEVDANGAAFFYRHSRSVSVPHVNVSIPHGAFEAAGPLGVYVFNLDFEVREGGSTWNYRTGFITEQDGGLVRGERVEKAVLRLAAGHLTLRSLHEMEFRAPEATLELAGGATLSDAAGALRGDDATWRADGATRLDGEASYRLAPGERAAAGPLATGPRPLLVGIAGDPSLIGFSVLRDPAPFALDSASAAGAAAGGGALLLAVLGAVAWRRRHPKPQPEGLVEAAVLRLEAGDHGGALSLFNEALARDPRSPTLHLDRAHCLERLGRLAESRRAYELAVRFAPDNGEAHYHLARTLATSGLAPSAIAHLSRAFSLDPAFAQVAREEPAFRALHDHPTYEQLHSYYQRST